MAHAFRTDRTFAKQFTDVWLWEEWPGKTTVDIGVDLVARAPDGGLIAIQCKCYDPQATLDKGDVDSFISESSKAHWARRIIVSTTDKWSKHAEEALEGHTIPIERLGVDHLDAMTVDWSTYDITNPKGLKATARHVLRPHQEVAVEKVRAGLAEYDRGKLVMACGTGKTFTALRIAEDVAGPGKSVLFLAPSIALVAQSLKEWTAEATVAIRPFAVCSDATAGKADTADNATTHDVVIPATTDPSALVEANVHEPDDGTMTVVFSTYQSIEVIETLQSETGLVFDLVICDEAHRTAGVASVGEANKVFSIVHDDTRIPAAKRLYMTATPRLFKPNARDAAAEHDAVLASMDDADFFGPELHRLGFGEAVEQGLLADYRVLILAVNETAISNSFQQLLSEGDGIMTLPDVARFVGCLSALAKLPGQGGAGFRPGEMPMQRAVAFWSNIKESERFASQFDQVAEAYFDQLESDGEDIAPLRVPTRHVDGTDKISSRRADIRWLKETPPEGECRVLTNAKCLTEGVDVPALDAVMFLTPRKSRIDIVQAVGRVMRKPPGKQLGYVILPVAVPAGLDPATALDKNKDYDAVWEVLQALRAHDERFNAYINQIALGTGGPDPDGKVVVVPVDGPDIEQGSMFTYEEWTGAIYSKIVAKVGTRTYWEDWARDVAAIAASHETRIRSILAAQPAAKTSFDEFVTELRATLNDGISDDDAVSMVSQHLITRPIFTALFGDDSFATANPVSQAMTGIAEVLDAHNLEAETEKLDGFYRSIQRRVEGIHPDDGEARQKIIKDLYGRFFKIAFPKVADSLGIVYTPIEVVDFIIRAVEAALHEHFDGASLSDEGVHVLDPFTGTGTFIARLIQSGFIKPHDLARKFAGELHANEILLLAYYIAAVNIEATYRQEAARLGSTDPGYEPFPGIVLADTFQLGEAGEGSGALDVFPVNNERAVAQRKLDIRVILGNPPYSAGQESANDDNANLKYPQLDASITSTYANRSTAKLKNSLYDSYVRAFRWASDRLLRSPHGGIVAFVTNGGFIDDNTFDGFRLSVAQEFHHLYVFNLRGNQRKSDWRKEGGKIFDAGSQATVAISLMVKEPGAAADSGAVLHYREIGERLTRDEKLSTLAQSILPAVDRPPSIAEEPWETLAPNVYGDWINQRSDSFTEHLSALPEDGGPSLFGLRSTGLKTGRDAWSFSSSESQLLIRQAAMIDVFNDAVRAGLTEATLPSELRSERLFKWTDRDYRRLASGRPYDPRTDIDVLEGLYRPFHPRSVNAAPALVNRSSLARRLYPNRAAATLAICVPPPGSMAPPFSALMTNRVIDSGLYASSATLMLAHRVFDPPSSASDQPPGLFTPELGWQHNVTDHALGVYRALDQTIEKDDIFFYVYGILHSPAYRTAFAADLKKSLPRIPQVPTAEGFWGFSNAGRGLATLHTEYEDVEVWPDLTFVTADGFDPASADAYRITKMKHPKVTDPATGAKVDDRTRIVYNDRITIEGIPEAAYGYELGSRSAIAWVMESWRIKTDKASGITNDPNDWATEHDDPTYILDLVGRVVTVSMKTLDIIAALPKLAL
ncbi:MAG: type ISP restriction/modification enzyme [Acidimicrobiales bacterium]|nr:type ISP restriction/modification enzyme [Acidimicrobiales bacterium]GJM36929.1 MAG: helicase [Acidimicrobiales bacterium]